MSQAEPNPAGEPVPIVLPRPNLGPEPWSSASPVWTPLELGIVVAMVVLIATLAVLKRRRLRAAARDERLGTSDLDVADLTPSQRLVASSAAVRAALIAEFGPTWGARTTQEIAADPLLADRLGPVAAESVVDYLDQVDRAKFAGEEFISVDEWINSAQTFLDQFPMSKNPTRRAS